MSNEKVKLTKQQQRVLNLLFKFRFVSSQLLADVMKVKRPSVYQVLEHLVSNDLVAKVYKSEYRIDRKPAYYYLTKQGVTAVRKLLDVPESVVHAVYKNDTATTEFINHCLTTMTCYVALLSQLPADTQIFTKTEINRFKQFPKNRPDLYIRTADGQEAIIVLVAHKPAYIIRKRLDEIITHSEDEGWDGDYPRICFIVQDESTKHSFLYTSRKKLESMGFDDDEIHILASSLEAIRNTSKVLWVSAMRPKQSIWPV